MQLAGSKVWSLRPNPSADWPAGSSVADAQELVRKHVEQQGAEHGGEVARLRISCRAGDLLLLNTRLWFHSTQIPSTLGGEEGASAGANHIPLSMSVARDFYIGKDARDAAASHSSSMKGAGGCGRA